MATDGEHGRGEPSYPPGIDILFLCTGNTCRSPMAAGLLARRAHDLGINLRSHSAGVMPGERPAAEHAVEVLRERGVDISGHRSRRVDAPMLSNADIVIGMTREHVREAVTIEPTVWPRAFTLKELVRRGIGTGSRHRDETTETWLARVGQGRARSDLLGASSLDDVDDPVTQPLEVYERTARELDNLVGRVIELVWPGFLET